MAQAAEEQADLTSQLLIVTIVEIIALVAILGLTIYSARLSREANSIARKSSERQLRAYVMVEDIQFERLPVAQDGEPRFIIVINIRNSGQTPAKDHRIQCAYFFAREYERSLFDDVSSKPASGPTPISPQGTTAATMVPNQTEEDWRNFTSGATKLFVYGLITYEDAFENEWKTTFRMAKDYNLIKSFNILPEGNEST